MNLLQALWNWLTGGLWNTPTASLPPAESESECCDGECEPEEKIEQEREPAQSQESVDTITVSEILKEILLSERIGEKTIEKLQILQLFEEWYDGDCSREAIRKSIPDFKSAKGGAINAKLNRIK